MNKLETYRKQHSLSYTSLAKAVGLPKATVWRHCNNTLMPDITSVSRYMQRLGLSFVELRPDLWPQQEVGEA